MIRHTCSLLLIFFCLHIANGQTQKEENSPLTFGELEGSGFNADSIQHLANLIWETPPKDFRGLVVIKNNEVVIEEYFHTFWRNTIHDIRSAGKSITAMLLGIAIEQGLVDDIDRDIYSFFPKDKYPAINEDYKKFTLRHVLNMSSGLDADSEDNNTPGHAGQWIAMDDWSSYLLSVPHIEEPGKKWVYADIHALLIGMIVEETSGMSLKDFAKKYLFDPLGIEQWYWYTNASGQTGAAGNLYLTTLDFAKLGMVIVNEGKWGDQQLMEESYVEELISSKVFDVSDIISITDYYGFMWYKSHREFGDNTFDYLYASGNGGNHLVVIPDREIVIALTSSAYGPGLGHRRTYNIMGRVLRVLEE